MQNLTFPLAPFEDRKNGRNNNVYLAANGNHPTQEETETFIKEIKNYAIKSQKETSIPASVVIAMAVLESGSGFTRIAHFANNLFGIKNWGGDSNSWQLKGQPDEGEAKAVETLGPDRVIFEEASRKDNWYRKFSSREEAVRYLTGTFLLKDRYKPARDNYLRRIKEENWQLADAAKKYAYEIADLGYNHKGGSYYEKMVSNIMDRWNLYVYDTETAKEVPATTAEINNTSAGQFKMKYEIKKAYLDAGTKKRTGNMINKVEFVVAHDTGNPGYNAKNHVDYYRERQNQESNSAHTFIDDNEIIECIPTGLSGDSAEKAQHVMNSKPADNRLYGGDANDIALGVELCYGGQIKPEQAYAKYVWYLAYACFVHKLNPSWDVVGHMILDPQRRVDPQNALSTMGKTYEHLLKDVGNEYRECTTPLPQPTEYFLQEGSKGTDVLKLQENLNFLGINTGPLDGIFGPKTKNAVMKYQSQNNLQMDGIVGPKTEFKLQEQLSKLCLAGKC